MGRPRRRGHGRLHQCPAARAGENPGQDAAGRGRRRDRAQVHHHGRSGQRQGHPGQLLKDDFDLVHISVGDLFRWNVQNHTKLGARVRRLMEAGELVPDDLVEEVVKARLEQHDWNHGFILDGFPRDVTQAALLPRELRHRCGDPDRGAGRGGLPANARPAPVCAVPARLQPDRPSSGHRRRLRRLRGPAGVAARRHAGGDPGPAARLPGQDPSRSSSSSERRSWSSRPTGRAIPSRCRRRSAASWNCRRPSTGAPGAPAGPAREWLRRSHALHPPPAPHRVPGADGVRGRGLVPSEGHDDGRCLLLPGGLAEGAVAARPREHQEARVRVRAHGRVRLGLHGAGRGPVRFRLARRERAPGRRAGTEGRAVHAFGHAACLARRASIPRS